MELINIYEINKSKHTFDFVGGGGIRSENGICKLRCHFMYGCASVTVSLCVCVSVNVAPSDSYFITHSLALTILAV